jgi:very-short-patch-repair endonuclease
VAVETAFAHDIHGKSKSRRDAAIAELANRGHGVVSRAQLTELGLGRGAIEDRVARGSLHPVYRGVYAVGHGLLSRHGRWMAAVLAAGPDAVLSHRSAAELWGIRNSARSPIEVIAPRQRRRPGIQARHIVLPPDETTVEHGIPVTNPARTLFDLAAVVTQQQLEHALNEAEIRRLTSPFPLDALIARHPRRRGTQALKRALEKQRQHGQTVIRSDFETAFLDFTEQHGLPRPITNQPLGPYEPDALWPDQRLVVELDSYDIHTTRQAFEADRERDRALMTAGYRVLRITWRQLTHDKAALASELRTLLGDTVQTP